MSRRVFSQREMSIFIIMVSTVLMFTIYKAVYIPLFEKRQDIRTRIQQAEDRLNQNRKMMRKASVFDRKYADILQALKQQDKDEKIMSSIFSEIETVASGMQMRIADMKPRKVRSVDLYNQFSVSLTLDGPMANIMQFLYSLENAPHLFYVEEMSLSKMSANRSELRCQLVLSRVLIP